MRRSNVRRTTAFAFAALAATLPASTHASSAPDLVRKHTAADTTAAQKSLPALVDFGPGWTATQSSAQSVALTCPGSQPRMPGVVETGAATSNSFQASPSGPFVSASAWVYKSAAQAATVWKLAVGPGLLRCFVRSVEQGSTSGVTFAIDRAAQSSFARVAARTAAFRILATARKSGESVKTYYTLIMLARDRRIAEVSLAALRTPAPAATELRLARLVAGRLG